jgi:23S rRNA (uracil1939-C5)-methyltransferase
MTERNKGAMKCKKNRIDKGVEKNRNSTDSIKNSDVNIRKKAVRIASSEGGNSKEVGRIHKKEEKMHKKEEKIGNEEGRTDKREKKIYKQAKKIGKKGEKTKRSDIKKIRPTQQDRKLQECAYIRQCGSCKIFLESYEKHLKGKQKQVNSLMGKYCRVETILSMEDPFYYRNKVHVVFDHDQKGNSISGVYEEKTHRVVPIQSCYIHNRKADAIISSIRQMLKSFKIRTYDEDTGYGLLRHVLIRAGFTTGEIMVVLVVSSPIFPSRNNFVKALLKQHPEISTIVLNVNNKKTSMVLGEKERTIYGKGYIEDRLCGKIFRISPKSFYQVNPKQTEILYKKAIELAGLKGNETVLDAYCGIGTISMILSDQVKKVIGVELNSDAVRDAVVNTNLNGIKNIDFYHKDAGEFMCQLAQAAETVDVVFMDPPRTGSDDKFLRSMVQLEPGKVVYISCNPVTLERNVKYLVKKGYEIRRVVPVDMFPWTNHVETVIMMTYCGKGRK